MHPALIYGDTSILFVTIRVICSRKPSTSVLSWRLPRFIPIEPCFCFIHEWVGWNSRRPHWRYARDCLSHRSHPSLICVHKCKALIAQEMNEFEAWVVSSPRWKISQEFLPSESFTRRWLTYTLAACCIETSNLTTSSWHKYFDSLIEPSFRF